LKEFSNQQRYEMIGSAIQEILSGDWLNHLSPEAKTLVIERRAKGQHLDKLGRRRQDASLRLQTTHIKRLSDAVVTEFIQLLDSGMTFNEAWDGFESPVTKNAHANRVWRVRGTAKKGACDKQ